MQIQNGSNCVVCDTISKKMNMSKELGKLVKNKKKTTKKAPTQTDEYYGNDVLILSDGQVTAFRDPKDPRF